MPVKIANSFSPYTPVGDSLNQAITTYANSIPTYDEVQSGRVNQNKADAPVAIGDAVKSMFSQIAPGQQFTPQMVQDNLPKIAQALAMGGNIGEYGNVLRATIANSANPESTQMIDRSQQGAGQAYSTTQTGFDTTQKNDLLKVDKQQAGANYRAQIAAQAKGQQLKLDAATKGKNDLSNILSDIDERMQLLDKGGDYTDSEGNTQHAEGGAIPSVGSGTLHNLEASASAGPLGQYIGGKVGSTNQSLRNDINSRLPLIKQAVMSATGMSSRQLDSNVELKTFMQALSDPAKDVQSNRGTLRNLDRLYGSGRLAGKNTSAAGSTPADPSAVMDGGGGEKPTTDGSIYDDVTGKTYRMGDDGQYYEE